MDPVSIFWVIWMIALPIFAILFMVFAPIFWFLIVPAIARMLTLARFKKVSFHMVADDTGYTVLLPTKEELPEGIVQTKLGYRFLPQPTVKENPTSNKDRHIEALLLRKFIWKDMGKPIWFGHVGHVASVNPTVLAATQQPKKIKAVGHPDVALEKLREYVKKLPKTFTFGGILRQKSFNLRSDLMGMLKVLDTEIHRKVYTVLDATKVAEIVPQLYTPSQMDAYGQNRIMKGMIMRGKEYGKLILGSALIIGLVIIAILLVVTLGQ